RQPPCKHNTEKKSNCGYLAPKRPGECERNRKCNCQECSYNLVCVAEWTVKPYGAECPSNSNHGCEEDEQLTDPANNSQQILNCGHNGSRASKPLAARLTSSTFASFDFCCDAGT